MTDKEKIRAFVKGRKKENWEKRYNNSGGDLFWDRANEDDEILSFIDSLQEEPKLLTGKTKLEKIIAVADNMPRATLALSPTDNAVSRDWERRMVDAAESLGISQDEYDKIVDECIYGKEPELVDSDDLLNSSKEEPVSEDYDNALHSEALTFLQEQQVVPNLYADMIIRAVKHGAQWQKEKDDEEKVLTYKHGFEDCKEQMMTKAIGAHCFGFQGAALFSFRLPADNYLVGSEVKVIVIKED